MDSVRDTRLLKEKKKGMNSDLRSAQFHSKSRENPKQLTLNQCFRAASLHILSKKFDLFICIVLISDQSQVTVLKAPQDMYYRE